MTFLCYKRGHLAGVGETAVEATRDAAGAELRELQLHHDTRRVRVARAVEKLRETFVLRPGCNTIEDAAEDACVEHRDLRARLRAVECLCVDLAQAFESATPDAWVDSVEADSWATAKMLLDAKQPDWQAEVQVMRERRDARLREASHG